MRVVFIHPDLGIGGAERFVVDAAIALQNKTHVVTIFTPHFDALRCFDEVTPPIKKVRVVCKSPYIPRAIFGRFQALLASLRCAIVALYVCIFCRFDVAVVDIVSLPLLVFAMFRAKTVFYCHYPDKLLAKSLDESAKTSFVKRLYRGIIDAVDAFSLTYATKLVCNSHFTAKAFMHTFPRLPKPRVIYPCVSVPPEVQRKESHMLLSLNRYERKKNISLAITSLASVLENKRAPTKELRLVIAGGYDDRLPENVQHFKELKRLARLHKVRHRVTMIKNVSDEQRRALLEEAALVLYTPPNEHFGIVPLEAMAHSVPVVALNSGGPLETVEDGKCGFLCDNSPRQCGEAIAQLVNDRRKNVAMGRYGRRRVESVFSRSVLAAQLDQLLSAL